MWQKGVIGATLLRPGRVPELVMDAELDRWRTAEGVRTVSERNGADAVAAALAYDWGSFAH